MCVVISSTLPNPALVYRHHSNLRLVSRKMSGNWNCKIGTVLMVDFESAEAHWCSGKNKLHLSHAVLSYENLYPTQKCCFYEAGWMLSGTRMLWKAEASRICSSKLSPRSHLNAELSHERKCRKPWQHAADMQAWSAQI